MGLSQQQGKLIRWEDNRGFGFIQPDDGGTNVFVHISDIRRVHRRPQVGDRLSYTVQTQPDGKTKAVSAQLLGVPMPSALPMATVETDWARLWRVVIGIVLVGLILYNLNRMKNDPSRHNPRNSLSSEEMKMFFSDDTGPQNDSSPPPGYTIKGNISVGTGERFYHVPGSRDYFDTKIDRSRGELWFRTEAEALAAGWKKAPSFGSRNRR